MGDAFHEKHIGTIQYEKLNSKNPTSMLVFMEKHSIIEVKNDFRRLE